MKIEEMEKGDYRHVIFTDQHSRKLIDQEGTEMEASTFKPNGDICVDVERKMDEKMEKVWEWSVILQCGNDGDADGGVCSVFFDIRQVVKEDDICYQGGCHQAG